MKIVFILAFCASTIFGDDTPSAQEFQESNKRFTSTVYKQIAKLEKNNFIVSPFSAQTLLTLTQCGSENQTAEEIRNVLHLSNDTTKIEEEVKNLLPTLKGNDAYTFHTLNKMYVKDNFEVKNNFSKIATDIFAADTENIDFTKRQEAAETMNTWIEKQTENKIQNLISPSILDNDTRIILVNAVYFKANWSFPFYLANTRKMKFHKTNFEIVAVDSMHNKHLQYFNYYECHHLNSKFLEMPFKGLEASMTIVLPNERDGLSDLENQIDRALLPHNLTGEFLKVALPKFQIETTSNLKTILKQVGVVTVFEDFEADLSKIAGEKGDLVVSEIIQKSCIDVNELGVEAAAATFQLFSVPRMGRLHNMKEFIADHPFLFYIKIKGVIVFVGRVTDPSK